MPQMDVLKALDDLKAAGFEEGPARVMIRLVTDAVELQAATKADLERECMNLQTGTLRLGDGLRAEIAGLRDELRAEIAGLRDELRVEIAGLRDEMRAEIAGLRDEMRAEITGVREEMRTQVAELRAEIAAVRDSLNARLLTVVGLHFGGTALLLGGFYALLR